MRILSWVVFGALGFGIMCFAYFGRDRTDPGAAWSHGLIVIGPQPPAGQALPGGATPVRLRLLPGSERIETILKGIDLFMAKRGPALRAQLEPKLIGVPFHALGIDQASLESGRLPAEKSKEALAGPGAARAESLVSGSTTFNVVGRLKRDYAVFDGSYLIPAPDVAAGSGESSMPLDDPAVHSATLIHLTQGQMGDRKVLGELAAAFPATHYFTVATQERLDAKAFFTYIGGLALMLMGGSGALISLFNLLADRSLGSKAIRQPDIEPDGAELVERKPWPGWLAAPLIELQRWPRLVWAVHVYYFGLVILGSMLVHAIPEVQTVLLSNVTNALSAESGPLAAASQAYESGNVLRAASVTFCVNFLVGSLLWITLPSIIVPGSGILLAAVRSIAWGLLFAPTLGSLASGMIPHSGTLLLEGEAYILATIFASLIPIRIVQSSLGGNPLSRFGRAILLNIQASFWVALVLAVAALYEAVEVIAMTR